MKFKSKAEALPSPPPPPTTVHHHAPSAFGAVFSKVLAVITGLIFFWFAGIFLLGKIGVRHPDEVLAKSILFGLMIIVLVGIVSIISDRFLTRWFEFQKEMRDKDIQYARQRRMLLQSAVADTRPSQRTERRNSLVLQIMDEAYTYLTENGKFRGAWRPWSRRNAAAMVLLTLGETEPVGEGLAVEAKQFLVKNGVIVDNRIDLKRYPDLASIQKLLYAPVLLPVTDASAHPTKVIRGKFQGVR